MNSLLTKGSYKPINREFLVEGHEILEEVALVQQKWNKGDTDTFINELRDSMAGYYLGYDLVNTEKHGFDCKKSANENIFLEVKSASFSSSTWSATFNDTNLEKAQCFQSPDVYLCLAVWKNASDLLFMVYGQNPQIGKFLHQKVVDFLSGIGGVRSTQSIGMNKLVFDYGFDIICVNKSKQEVMDILKLKSREYFNLPESKVLTLSEYMRKYEINKPIQHNTDNWSEQKAI